MFEFPSLTPEKASVDGAGAPRRLSLRTIACLAIAIAAWPACAQTLTDTRYIEPVNRYGHFALGRPHEYAAVTATTGTGKTLTLHLAADEVFEDLAPRIVKLSPNAADELLVIVSNRTTGSRLALVGQHDGRLILSAQSAPIGTPMRWLNPVGIADLDGDGQAEIAAVITPHIGGILKVYRHIAEKLVEVAAMDGFSNHTYGSPEQALSLVTRVDSQPRLLVPDATKTALRLIALRQGHLVETARCPLENRLTGPVQLLSDDNVRIFANGGQQLVNVSTCAPSPR